MCTTRLPVLFTLLLVAALIHAPVRNGSCVDATSWTITNKSYTSVNIFLLMLTQF